MAPEAVLLEIQVGIWRHESSGTLSSRNKFFSTLGFGLQREEAPKIGPTVIETDNPVWGISDDFKASDKVKTAPKKCPFIPNFWP